MYYKVELIRDIKRKVEYLHRDIERLIRDLEYIESVSDRLDFEDVLLYAKIVEKRIEEVKKDFGSAEREINIVKEKAMEEISKRSAVKP
jgi:archaellum component FlaC